MRRRLPADDAPFRRSGHRATSTRGIRLLAVPAIAVALLIVWPAWASFYAEWLWFGELGYQVVFTRILTAKFALGLAVALAATTLLWLNFKIALRITLQSPRVERFFHFEGQRVAAPDFAGLARHAALPAALVIGLLVGAVSWVSWDRWLLYQHQVPFGKLDPLFSRDISFYVFTLPVLELLSGLALAIAMASLIGLGAVIATGYTGSWPVLNRAQRTQSLIIVAVLFLILALRAYLSMPGLVYSTAGPIAGAGYADIAARLPLLKVTMGAAVVAAVLALVCIFRSRNRLLWLGTGIYAAALATAWAYPNFIQRFSVAPNELAKEAPYIELNIAATRKAFGLESVEERELSGETALTRRDIDENRRTINNIRLWDQQPLLDTFAQIQEIRTYYEFQSVDNDRYRINGEMQQVMLSARELSTPSLPNRNWINERLTFTHGFGLTLGPVNQVTPEGLPVLFMKDIPPASSLPSLKVERPEIYFGELSSDPVYVKTRAKEFSYPSGEENVFTHYGGSGGVAIGSLGRQLLFATTFADMKLLLSDDLTSESRVLFRRNVRERLSAIAPFLRFDSDPYLVISEGRLFWITDAYTVTNRYPYSQPVSRDINYIRNSVKAVVDAYHGDVRLYIADAADPLIQTYARAFPGMLRPLSEMPTDLRAHLRYPEDIFKIQTAVYSTYHMDQPQVFYNKEDQWTVASMGASTEQGNQQVMSPYYTIMKLPGEQSEEFILMLPFTPARKDNLASWMVARADGDHYGRLLVYRFPKQKLIFGPRQIVARINQDPEISRQLTLWNQRGSQVIFGNLMVIPIEESLIYVQALYLRAENGKIPELRRVIVAAENRIAMEPTLDAGLAAIFGGAATRRSPDTEQITRAPVSTDHDSASKVSSLVGQARQHYMSALQAQREGDWARYGEEIKRLGEVLDRVSKQD